MAILMPGTAESKDSQLRIKLAVGAGILLCAISLAGSLLILDLAAGPAERSMDLFLLFCLTVGLAHKSRTAAIILFFYFVLTRVPYVLAMPDKTHQPPFLFAVFLFSVFFFTGLIGTVAHHRAAGTHVSGKNVTVKTVLAMIYGGTGGLLGIAGSFIRLGQGTRNDVLLGTAFIAPLLMMFFFTYLGSMPVTAGKPMAVPVDQLQPMRFTVASFFRLAFLGGCLAASDFFGAMCAVLPAFQQQQQQQRMISAPAASTVLSRPAPVQAPAASSYADTGSDDKPSYFEPLAGEADPLKGVESLDKPPIMAPKRLADMVPPVQMEPSEEQAENVFIEALADKKEAAVDEPVKVTYKLWTRYDTRYEGFEKEPELRDFWIEEKLFDKNPSTEQERRSGKRYVSAAVREMTLYPLREGELVIRPGILHASIREEQDSSPLDAERKHLRFTPGEIRIKVKKGGPSRYLAALKPAAQQGKARASVILLIDVSGTMLAEDVPGSRLAAVKKIAEDFIRTKPNANIGVKVFARGTRTLAPLSENRPALDFGKIEAGMIADGTALGDAIFESVLELSPAAGPREIIILTDSGENNAGHLHPLTAADIARRQGVRIHTIGVGEGGMAPFPINDPVLGKRMIRANVRMDDGLYDQLAKITGGGYAKSANVERLNKAFAQLRKTLNV